MTAFWGLGNREICKIFNGGPKNEINNTLFKKRHETIDTLAACNYDSRTTRTEELFLLCILLAFARDFFHADLPQKNNNIAYITQ